MRFRSIGFFAIVIATFFAGTVLGYFKRAELYVMAQRLGLTKVTIKPDPYQQLWKSSFNEPIYYGDLNYDSIDSLAEIKIYLERDLIPTVDFENAFENITLLRTEQLYFKFQGNDMPAIKIYFLYRNKEYITYVYGLRPKKESAKATATLIIPGSGLNQSSAIYSGDSYNYQFGILKAIEQLKGDVYVFVKPNEDFLAYHDRYGKKISAKALVNYQLNLNSSYSASYLLKAMAIIKWFKTLYRQTVIAGLSQGGAATLFTSIYTQPDIAIVSSGHSILFNDVNIGGMNQLLGVPGYFRFFECNTLRKTLELSKTNFLFTWGIDEEDYYGIESKYQPTAKCIKDLVNVRIAIHKGGHIFPVEEIQNYLTSIKE
jgi:hypothetical protein